ncbi:uncharacterized protein MEPE_02635 [Melanopsichium pennsylvanicum]|uniref:EthD domain-containing protein n=2 Tax=Melanopsichium pennsylvanicum TaxID=63383 RepID=A0AAJ5C4R1_9BASI|nr:uncharacterized protein BN887_04920 [Melanopsichium pennsylvanicum 4]SNX83927.1 uncharacterized protein MEPE_02635 [Melanopsichium pennsylvanicum]
MRLIIFSRNLADQSEEKFYHEFHNVHAEQTSTIAANTGILHQYIQGYAANVRKANPKLSIPLPIRAEVVSVALLTWPSIKVMRGLFSSSGYQKSAGAHHFADASVVCATENLEPEPAGVRTSSQVMLHLLLKPRGDSATFKSKWDSHADLVRSLPSRPTLYQRHLSVPLTREQATKLYKGTQFAVGEGNWIDGGVEEFVFDSSVHMNTFLEAYSQKLDESYRNFVEVSASSAAIFDQTVVYGPQRGLKQSIVGTAIGAALSIKDTLGL